MFPTVRRIIPCIYTNCAKVWKLYHNQTAMTANELLSAKNRQKCIECFQNLKSIDMKMARTPNEKKFAAVLIAICTNAEGDVSILYTRRSGQLSRHIRQISFPGGIKDQQDVDFIECALRETEEEIGLRRQRIEIWGTGKLLTPPLTAAIMPVVGVIRNFNINELQLNDQEVEEAFTIKIASLAARDSLRHTQFKRGYSTPTFVVDNYRIWGITGYLTKVFLKCLIENFNEQSDRTQFIPPFKYS